MRPLMSRSGIFRAFVSSTRLGQISDSTTSYGSYSGAAPNEKITWGKLGLETPKFIIESDASIVAPLMFAWILGL